MKRDKVTMKTSYKGTLTPTSPGAYSAKTDSGSIESLRSTETGTVSFFPVCADDCRFAVDKDEAGVSPMRVCAYRL